MSEAERVSPLSAVMKPGSHGLLAGGLGVQLSSRLCPSLVQVQAWPDTLPAVRKAVEEQVKAKLPTGRFDVLTSNSSVVMPTGPGRFLIECAKPEQETVLRSKISSDIGAVTGLTHSRVVVRVGGPKAAWLLATGIGLDFALVAFPAATVQLTHHHEIGLTVHRVDEETFELYAFTSYARGLWHWLTTAAGEVGYEVAAAS